MADLYVVFNSLRLDRDGFMTARDITALTTRGPLRGDDWTSDGVDGDTFLPKSQGSHIAICSWLVHGKVNSAGVAHPDNFSGLRDNIEEIEAAVLTATEAAPQTLTVHYPDTGTRSALAWCRKVDVTPHDNDRLGIAQRLVLDIRIPSGVLTA